MPIATRKEDKRLIRATGIYETREELIAACRQYRKAGLSHMQMSELVGVAACTISRILNGDKKTYNKPKPAAPLSLALTGNIGQLNALWPAANIPEEYYDDVIHRLGQPPRMW